MCKAGILYIYIHTYIHMYIHIYIHAGYPCIQNVRLSRERKEKQFTTHAVPELKIDDKVLVKNHNKNFLG